MNGISGVGPAGVGAGQGAQQSAANQAAENAQLNKLAEEATGTILFGYMMMMLGNQKRQAQEINNTISS